MKKYSLHFEDGNQTIKVIDIPSEEKGLVAISLLESLAPKNNCDYRFFLSCKEDNINPINDISHASSLDDIELPQMLVHLRHEYLEAAKDLSKEGRDKQDIEFGDMACDHALSIQNILDSIGL